MCKFINIQQSTKTRIFRLVKRLECKFINIQQSTKTKTTLHTRSGCVSLSISNRVLKPSCFGPPAQRQCKFINIQQSTKTGICTALPFLQCKFINIQQSTKTHHYVVRADICVSLSISNRVLKRI